MISMLPSLAAIMLLNFENDLTHITSYDGYQHTYLLFRSSPLPQPHCPGVRLDLSFLSIRKEQNFLRQFCIKSLSYSQLSLELLTVFLIRNSNVNGMRDRQAQCTDKCTGCIDRSS